MKYSSHSKDPAVNRFFNNYLDCLKKTRIKPNLRHWYIKHIKYYIQQQNGIKIKQVSVDTINNHLDGLGRRETTKPWQLRQHIQALQILYCDLFASEQCQAVDWDYWFSSCQNIPDDHPATAQEFSAEELTYLKERKGNSALQQIRKDNHSLLVQLASEIRVRGYAYRTEQAYEQWVCRFILFCGGIFNEATGSREVSRFVNYLSVTRNVTANTQNQALCALVFLFKHVLN